MLLSALFFAVAANAAVPEMLRPEPGEYAVLISEKNAAKKDWRAAAEKFRKHYAGTLIVWRGDDIESARTELRNARPRYVAVFARPEEIDRVFVAKFHRISREMNDDRWGDFLWGIITGADGATAAAQLAGTRPLRLERALGTTNFDQRRFRESFFITDWAAREFVETKNYVVGEKRSAAAGEMTDIFAERWKSLRPQYLITASHATEYNLEMPFGEGLIASAGTHFFRVPKNLLPAFAKTLGNESATLAFERKNRLKKLPASAHDKIWIAAGNCLFGDMLRTRNSMAGTAISSAGVKQLFGYTVPSWFGEMGWGTHARFFDGCRTETPSGEKIASVAQAWFFTNQILLSALNENAARAKVPLDAAGMRGANLQEITGALAGTGSELSRDALGRFHDRDTTAFYGDPLFAAEFDPGSPTPPKTWICAAEIADDAMTFRITASDGNARKGELCIWFPRRADTKTPPKIGGNAPEIFTENFAIFREISLAAGETAELRVPRERKR